LGFERFCERYTDFGDVEDWMRGNKIILVVDELNVIPYDAEGYQRMRSCLHDLVAREGSALIYSTHLRETADLLRERLAGRSAALSTREHKWLMIPRIVNENCLRGLLTKPVSQPSFWCAVLRGRLPALLVQPDSVVAGYGREIFSRETSDHDRMTALAAVITGDISQLPSQRGLFKAYSYMSERFEPDDGSPLFAWAPFLVSQFGVLGKHCSSLRTSLEDPNIDESKAFEALTQLAVLVHLLSGEHHELVPHSGDIPEMNSFKATEIFHVHNTVKTIDRVIEVVEIEFRQRRDVLHLVAVPYFASFPVYDFFVLHRHGDNWKVTAGYQCKQGTERPSEDAASEVPLSVWIEGNCRKYRVHESGSHLARNKVRGWELLGESSQASMLGVSVSEALPLRLQGESTVERRCCSAKEELARKVSDANSADSSSSEESPDRKKLRSS
jgi:hypothetical protein